MKETQWRSSSRIFLGSERAVFLLVQRERHSGNPPPAIFCHFTERLLGVFCWHPKQVAPMGEASWESQGFHPPESVASTPACGFLELHVQESQGCTPSTLHHLERSKPTLMPAERTAVNRLLVTWW